MNCVIFAKMDQVFSKKKKIIKNTGKWKQILEKSWNFCRSKKVGTMLLRSYLLINKQTKSSVGSSFDELCFVTCSIEATEKMSKSEIRMREIAKEREIMVQRFTQLKKNREAALAALEARVSKN